MVAKSKLKGKAMAEAREGWSSLPREIVELIAGGLVPFADRVSVRAVCTWWRDVLSGTVTSHPSSPPYLYSSQSLEIRCLLEKKNYYLPYDKANNPRLLGATNGWLSAVDSESVVSLLDPFSGACIKFPPLCNLPDVDTVEYKFDPDVESSTVDFVRDDANQKTGFLFFLKPEGILISADDLRDTLLNKMALSSTMKAIIVYHNNNKLAFAGPRSKTWTKIEIPLLHLSPFEVVDVVYHEADSKFYALVCNGVVISIDPYACHDNFQYIVPRDNLFQDLGPMWHCNEYLVSLPTGELLCILVIFVEPFKMLKKTRFEIRKLVREDENITNWKRVESLDGWTIFLDAKSAQARPCREPTGYQGNCIYFQWEGKAGQFGLSGVYHIGEKKFQREKYDVYQGLWIEPKTMW